MINTLIAPKNGKVEIAVVGKYITLQDSYKSIYEALTHGGIANNTGIITRRVESEDIEKKSAEELLAGVSGILVPGGFGDRGIEGKIEAIKYARENNIPFFGICLGMQCATMEFARNVCDMQNANSTEFNKKTPFPVIDLMKEQKSIRKKGGTMRLGAYPCTLKKNTVAESCYGITDISERHRHRWEFNNNYRQNLCDKGLVLSGLSPDDELVEIIEYPEHSWFVACQFHPEFQSTPLQAHPLFKNFITAAINIRDRKKNKDA